MSLILDALRKSENDRERQSLPGLVERPVSAGPPSRLPIVLAAIGALLVINVIVLCVVLFRSPAAAPAAAPAPAAAAPAAAAPVREDPGYRTQPDSRLHPASPRTRPLDAEAADVDSDPNDIAPPAGTRPPPPVPTSGARRPIVTATRSQPERTQTSASPPAPALNDLPEQLASGMPHVNIDLHVYADLPADRFVVINGQRLKEGGVLREGPVLERITTDGVVLSYRGTRYTVPRQ